MQMTLAGFGALILGLAAMPGVDASSSAPESRLLTGMTQPASIFGGEAVNACGWPSAVSLGACSGILIHPQVVVYAAHCGTDIPQVYFGEDVVTPARSVPTVTCGVHPTGGPGTGFDAAFCILEAPQDDLPIVPPLVGCEADVIEPNREVVLVGFGEDDAGTFGIKRAVKANIQYITENGEAFIGGDGKDSCVGDSGGPAFVWLSAEEGYDDTWRTLGIASYGGVCGTGGFYSLFPVVIPWLETFSGFDLTPCHESTGEWSPKPSCAFLPRAPETSNGTWGSGCSSALSSREVATCGPPYETSPRDAAAPVISELSPSAGQCLAVADGLVTAPLRVSATVVDSGSGVERVWLMNGDAQVLGAVRELSPFEFSIELGLGEHTLELVATDYHGNEARSSRLHVEVSKLIGSADKEYPCEATSNGCSLRGPGEKTAPMLASLALLWSAVGRRRRPTPSPPPHPTLRPAEQ